MMASSSFILLLLATLLTPSLQKVNYQPFSTDHEYCYDESTQLGLCLGHQQQIQLDFSNELLLECISCSGPYRGDESSCEELKQLHHNSTPTFEDSTNEISGEAEIISVGNISFCEGYNSCVRTKCPQVCWKEHVRWLECVIVELDCDLGCESVEYGKGFVGEEFILGVPSSGRKERGPVKVGVLLSLVGFCMVWLVN